jgi:BirA family biotin operon repressor/biotin-[acetyl-CoA-carboxylase] ligase
MTEKFNEYTLRKALDAVGETVEARFFTLCDSTNSEAKRMIASGHNTPCLIVAEEQSGGRGRLGRSFYSPRGAGVYFTLLQKVNAEAGDVVTLTCAAAVAAMRGILASTGRQTEIKWVNDLLLCGKKVCGILSESVISPSGELYVIIGIGINLRPIDFPKELHEIAGSLEDVKTARADLLASVVRELTPFLKDPRSRGWHDDYTRHSCVIGKKIRWGREGNWQTGEAVGLDSDGKLLVRSDDGTPATLESGEITLRRL